MILLVCIGLLALILFFRREGMTEETQTYMPKLINPNTPALSTAAAQPSEPPPVYECAKWDEMYPTDKYRGTPYCLDKDNNMCTKQYNGCTSPFIATKIGDIVRT